MTNQNQYDAQIEAYFSGTMTLEEKQTFEANLKTDKSLQEAIQPYLFFDSAIELVGEQGLKNIAKNVTNSTALATPPLSFSDRFRLIFTPSKSFSTTKESKTSINNPLKWGVVGIASLMLICVVYANFMLASWSDIAVSKDFGFTTEETETLGQDQQNAFSEAQKLFNSNDRAALENMANSTENVNAAAGLYYLAHWDLKNKQFNTALSEFDKLLQPLSIDVLKTQISVSVGAIKVNRLLAFIGKNGNKNEIIAQIDTLLNDPDCRKTAIQEKLFALKKEANSKWRSLRFKE